MHPVLKKKTQKKKKRIEMQAMCPAAEGVRRVKEELLFGVQKVKF